MEMRPRRDSSNPTVIAVCCPPFGLIISVFGNYISTRSFQKPSSRCCVFPLSAEKMRRWKYLDVCRCVLPPFWFRRCAYSNQDLAEMLPITTNITACFPSSSRICVYGKNLDEAFPKPSLALSLFPPWLGETRPR